MHRQILAGLPVVVVGATTGVVGIHGTFKVRRCREAKEKYARDLSAFTPPPR